ncbi:MAG: hypothetical protein HY293_13565 [Planctomycetes bacterium]|nr:hypothetical protein [Planctomycetota bacterium]
MGDPESDLAQCIDHAVAPHGFERLMKAGPPPIRWVAAWKRKTWNSNRGIALLSLPDQAPHAGEYALDIRSRAGKSIGYIPFVCELGLQLVLTAPGILKKGDGLDRYVTKINNSTVLLQSIHLIDPESRESLSVRTWGQVLTGRFIDAIEEGIAAFRGVGYP